MPDYSKSKIYKIVCNETGETYYGSTTRLLCQRMATHRHSLKSKNYICASFTILERGNYICVLCEEYPCDNKEQLFMRERFWIENNECVNKRVPIKNDEEKRQTHNESQRNYQNSDARKDIQREYNTKYQIEYRKRNIEKRKEYDRQRWLKKKIEKEQVTSHISS
jgi:hypothetical protein